MKNKSPLLLIILLLLTFISFQSNAGSINDASWYLSIDLEQIRSNKIYNLLKDNGLKSPNHDGHAFQVKMDTIPDEISYLTLYGKSKSKHDATLLIHGDFRSFDISQFVLDFMYTKDEISQLLKDRTIDYKGHTITVMTINKGGNDEAQDVFFTKINNNLSVVTFKRNDINSWIDGKYHDSDIKDGSLFSVVVNVKSAMTHMGMNIDKNDNALQSQMLKKVNQISASISEQLNEIHIDVALTAKNQEIANQIIMVGNGLIAMKNLSAENNDETLNKLIQNLSIIQEGNNVLINSFIDFNALEKLRTK